VNGPLGAAVVSDFDGTLAHLDIAWDALRVELSVARIEDLWADPGMRRWETVTRAEVDAARTAAPVPFVMDALSQVPAIAVLTSNDETAVDTFLDRWPDLRSRVRTVVGRRSLAGPKTDFEIFSSGYARCCAAIAPNDRPRIAYIGDRAYELDFARRLGAEPFAVTELDPAVRGTGRD
jgi:phosphoglycolate phosphatase-like HAD superfamily hydrolase